MFELKDLPSYDTLAAFGAAYGNPDVDGLHTWLVWASATNEMLSAFEGNLARNGGLSQSQFFVLLLLKRNPGGLSVGALAQGVAVTSQTMTRIIDRMEGAGLCLRAPDPEDRRAWLIRLAPPGDELLGQALPAHYAWVANLMRHFSAEERQMLNQLMHKLHAAGLAAE
ncbi:HTH-type transcriptional regulator MhqR [Achromobacter veterisilvae]|jgi:DNA-binding MarR family transcriptional regulator|uniref:HTH-type transcriptional regulator MhqR n=1 Tax=Achromobacter veterisilvae TaxID=2069367 RepID=A0A446D0Z4_9BURK|nr:MarR family transcriptional regulator [Achromobacter veterisilvae]SSW73799.1 HTH-type transcriptional regulator MhqR [Achromobacter veterisilvae]